MYSHWYSSSKAPCKCIFKSSNLVYYTYLDIFSPHGDEVEESNKDCELAKLCSSEESWTTPSRWSSGSVNNSGGMCVYLNILY